jgi:hypothetical protein
MANRMRCPASLLAALLVAGCSAQAAAGSPVPGGDAASAGRSASASPGRRAEIVPECRADSLDVKFGGGQPSAGNDFATIVVWDKASRACRLAGPVTLVGLGFGGSPDTNVVRLTVTGAGELTPHGMAPGPNQVLPRTGSAAWLLISAEYRDDPVTGGLCTAHQVEPAAFRLTLPAGGTVTVANGGLLTCRRELNTGSELTQVTIGRAT